MARESQRYQVGLIICIMIIVVQLALVFFFWRASNQSRQQVVDAENRATTANKERDRFDNMQQLLKAMLGVGDVSLKTLSEGTGFGVDDTLKPVQAQYDMDMKQFAPPNSPDTELGYTKIVKSLVVALSKTNEELAEANALVKAANDERDRRVAELEQQLKIARDSQQTLSQQLESEKEQFNTERAKYVADKQNDATQIAEVTKQLDELTASSEKRQKELTDKEANLVKQINKLKEELAKTSPNKFDVPDGKVITVNQTQRSLWLDLGDDDGLRAQSTFAVFDSHITVGQKGKPKARIEVTRVLGPHQSEARILDDELTNPIVRGDVVYSPAFRAGRSVHFGIVGKMDLNEDGVSDSELVRNLISMNGGKVDAEQKEDGSVEGEITSTTRYLILGEEPDTGDTAALEGFSTMQKDAIEYGVEILKVEEFLDMMGWKPEVEAVHLGDRASDEENRNNAFRSRRPPPPTPMNRGADGSAFE
jgi:hypothetical protein